MGDQESSQRATILFQLNNGDSGGDHLNRQRLFEEPASICATLKIASVMLQETSRVETLLHDSHSMTIFPIAVV